MGTESDTTGPYSVKQPASCSPNVTIVAQRTIPLSIAPVPSFKRTSVPGAYNYPDRLYSTIPTSNATQYPTAAHNIFGSKCIFTAPRKLCWICNSAAKKTRSQRFEGHSPRLSFAGSLAHGRTQTPYVPDPIWQ